MLSFILMIFVASTILIGIWAVATYNGIVRLSTLVQEAWSGIDVQLKRRSDLIPNLVATVKGYQQHESSTLQEVTRLRTAALNATTTDARMQAEQGLTQALRSLFAVAESYPELKANTNFQQLQEQLSSLEDQLQMARRYYNGVAREYNVTVQQFPSKIVASFAGFAAQPFFTVDDQQERQRPNVSF